MRAQASKDVLHHEDLQRWGGHMYVHLVGNLTKCVLQLGSAAQALASLNKSHKEALRKRFCTAEQAFLQP